MKRRIALCLLVVTLGILNLGVGRAQSDSPAWSQEKYGLQIRLDLAEKDKEYGTRWLVPYIELRNVGQYPGLQVNLQGKYLKIELVGADGVPLRADDGMPRSGPVPVLGTLTLPSDGFMRISLECRNWGVPKDASAMIYTDSGAWIIRDNEKGKVFLRATLTAEGDSPNFPVWGGKLQTPLFRVDWK